MVGSKVLVTGYSGLLGNTLCRQLLKEGFLVYGVAVDNLLVPGVKSDSLDLRELKEVTSLVKKINPKIIFHTAALTNVDYCEEHPKQAYEMNVGMTENMVNACKRTGSILVYISTDFVFDGRKGNYSEKDDPNPINAYGKTKLEGEEVILKSGIPFLITRTSLYGWNIMPKQSLMEAVLGRLEQNQKFTPFIDQYFNPVYTGTLSAILIELLRKEKKGLYNITADEHLSKFEFCRKVAQVFKLDENLLIPQESDKVEFKAKRPKDVSLNNIRLKKELGIKSLSVLTDLKIAKTERKLYAKT